MNQKWTSASPGIRYREHKTRRLKNGRPDRYYVLRYTEAGKQHEEALGWASDGWSMEKAQTVLSTLKQNIRTGDGPTTLADLREANQKARTSAHSEADTLTVSNFFDNYYLPAIQKRKRSWLNDRGRFNKELRGTLGDTPFRALDRTHIETMMDTLRKKRLAESTVLHYVAILRQMFSLAKLTFFNGQPLWTSALTPIQEIEKPEASVERERFLTYEEADILLDTAKNLVVEKQYLAVRDDLVDFIQLALNTGLRFGELMRLEWNAVSLQHAFLSVRVERHRKTGGHVPLNRTALDVLRRRSQKRKKGETLVFPPERIGKDGSIVRRLYARAVETADLNRDCTGPKDKVVFHTLRHTFGSWLALAGTDIYRIKTLMRHKTITMTMRYAHLLPDATREAVNNLRPDPTNLPDSESS